MKKRTKILLLMVTFVLAVAAMSVTAFAAEGDTAGETSFAPPEDWGSGEAITVFPEDTAESSPDNNFPEAVIPDDAGEIVGIEKVPELPDNSDGAFSVEGNGEVLDDIYDSKTGKEFYIITTANNNTFYLIIDHASSTQNVYMLSMIDENDLKGFITEEEAADSSDDPDAESKPAVDLGDGKGDGDASGEDKPDKEKKGGNTLGTVLIIVALGAATGGLCFYFKVYKPKKEAKISDEDDMEYIEEDAPVNEEEAGNEKITADTDINDLTFDEEESDEE